MANRTRHIPASVSRSQWARAAASRQPRRLRESRVTRRPHINPITCIRPICASAGAASLWGSRMKVRRGEGWLGLELFRFPRFSPLQSARQHTPLLSRRHIIPSTLSHIATRLFAAHFAVCLIIWRQRQPQCLTAQSECALALSGAVTSERSSPKTSLPASAHRHNCPYLYSRLTPRQTTPPDCASSAPPETFSGHPPHIQTSI